LLGCLEKGLGVSVSLEQPYNRLKYFGVVGALRLQVGNSLGVRPLDGCIEQSPHSLMQFR
jgi:hypothetical protein